MEIILSQNWMVLMIIQRIFPDMGKTTQWKSYYKLYPYIWLWAYFELYGEIGKFRLFFSRVGRRWICWLTYLLLLHKQGWSQQRRQPTCTWTREKKKIPIMQFVQRRLLWICQIVDTNGSYTLQKIASKLKKEQEQIMMVTKMMICARQVMATKT